MGLDSVELVMMVEKHFHIRIPDKEVEQIRTIDNFSICVLKYIDINAHSRCKSQYLFYVFRDYFVTEYGYKQAEFTPATPLGKIIPISTIEAVWKKMEIDFNIELPTLRKRDINPGAQDNFVTAFFGESRKYIGEYTVRNLINWILSLNHKKLISIDNLFSKEEVARIITGIISDTMGIDIEKIETHHSIVEDLGIN